MSWEVFEHKGYGGVRSRKPAARVQRQGNAVAITINSAAHEMLEGVEYVDLMFDPERMLVGLNPAENGSLRSAKVSRRGPNTSVSCTRFARHYRLTAARTYDLRQEEGVLVFGPVEREASPETR